MSYPFPWIAIEGPNGAGKTTLATGLAAELGSSARFVHEPPKNGQWCELFRSLTSAEKLGRHPDVLMSYLACSLAQQRNFDTDFAGALISDRSFVSTLAFFSNLDVDVRTSFAQFHYLPDGVIYLHDTESVLARRLESRSDTRDQLAFNRFYRDGYPAILAWLHSRGCQVLCIESSSVDSSELTHKALDFIRGFMPR